MTLIDRLRSTGKKWVCASSTYLRCSQCFFFQISWRLLSQHTWKIRHRPCRAYLNSFQWLIWSQNPRRLRVFVSWFDSVDTSYDILTPTLVSYDHIYHIVYPKSLQGFPTWPFDVESLTPTFPPRFASADFESDGNFNFEDMELWKSCFGAWCKEGGSSFGRKHT